MRKIIESTLVAADGVVGSPPLWAMDYRDEEVTRDALERLSGSDAMLMGRGTYELFAATWPGQSDDFAQRRTRTCGSCSSAGRSHRSGRAR